MAGSVYLETGDMDKAKSVSLSWMLLMKAFSSVFRSFNFELCDCNFDKVQGSTLGSFNCYGYKQNILGLNLQHELLIWQTVFSSAV